MCTYPLAVGFSSGIQHPNSFIDFGNKSILDASSTRLTLLVSILSFYVSWLFESKVFYDYLF